MDTFLIILFVIGFATLRWTLPMFISFLRRNALLPIDKLYYNPQTRNKKLQIEIAKEIDQFEIKGPSNVSFLNTTWSLSLISKYRIDKLFQDYRANKCYHWDKYEALRSNYRNIKSSLNNDPFSYYNLSDARNAIEDFLAASYPEIQLPSYSLTPSSPIDTSMSNDSLGQVTWNATGQGFRNGQFVGSKDSTGRTYDTKGNATGNTVNTGHGL
jgi:hypothetical protein